MAAYGPGSGRPGNNVCVVGTGVTGLLAVKNLVEQGLSVRALEQSENLGGNWYHSLDTEQVSALPEMKVNMSKETNCFTDFPMPDDYPSFPSAKQIGDYLEAYADKFELIKTYRTVNNRDKYPARRRGRRLDRIYETHKNRRRRRARV